MWIVSGSACTRSCHFVAVRGSVMTRAIVLSGLLYLASIVWGADRSRLEQADAAFNQGRYDEAIAAYGDVIRTEPTHIRAYLQVGRAYAAKARYDEAVAAFQKG